jgi:hypothetical protein
MGVGGQRHAPAALPRYPLYRRKVSDVNITEIHTVECEIKTEYFTFSYIKFLFQVVI